MPKTIAAVISLVLFALSSFAATPQELAFLSVWKPHQRDINDHDAVIQATRKVEHFGEFLPAVKTLAAWHLLASGNEKDAIRFFESALIKSKNKASTPIARHADIMARRWLTRLEIRKVDAALKRYYVGNVEFPSSLSPVLSLPPPMTPPKTDYFDDAWNYRLGEFSRLTGLKAQRYVLYSKTLGRHLSHLKDLPTSSYCSHKAAKLHGMRTSKPVSINLETIIDGESKKGIAVEGNLSNGVRFLKLSSDKRFALLCDSENDFWIVATP